MKTETAIKKYLNSISEKVTQAKSNNSNHYLIKVSKKSIHIRFSDHVSPNPASLKNCINIIKSENEDKYLIYSSGGFPTVIIDSKEVIPYLKFYIKIYPEISKKFNKLLEVNKQLGEDIKEKDKQISQLKSAYAKKQSEADKLRMKTKEALKIFEGIN